GNGDRGDWLGDALADNGAAKAGEACWVASRSRIGFAVRDHSLAGDLPSTMVICAQLTGTSACFTMSAHLSVSSATKAANSSGVRVSTMAPWSAMKLATLGSVRISLMVVLSCCTTSLGVPAGAKRPCQE